MFALLCAYGAFHVLSAVAGVFAYLSIIVIWPILALFRRWDGKVFAYYLMQDYAHSAQHYGAYPDELRDRLDQFGTTIASAMQDRQWDEILIIGHSSGAHLATSVLADLIRAGHTARSHAPIGFLTLGQVFPMVAFLPKADQLRADMICVGESGDLTWVDVTAPGDGCTFALCDPLAVTGLSGDGQRGPLVVSAAFSQTLKPETWARMKRRFFRLHFQYLCAFDNVWDYDYFRITAGSMTLAYRFADRAPSRSRITTPIARHRGVVS